VRGVLKSSPLPINASTPLVVAVVPLPGFDSLAFRMLTVFTYGGFVNEFCSKIPTSGWS
jgi:hypothetical protein